MEFGSLPPCLKVVQPSHGRPTLLMVPLCRCVVLVCLLVRSGSVIARGYASDLDLFKRVLALRSGSFAFQMNSWLLIYFRFGN
ncbi:hypothetical protein P8452_64145 [Trifolium repens]|nr:hypothetical protein P8452_64145 [Trifolium repens]